MTGNQLGGVLAARQRICGQDETIRLHAGCDIGALRYDLGGLSWEGRTGAEAGAEGIESAATWLDNLTAEENPTGRSLPPAVLFGRDPACAVAQPLLALRDMPRKGMWLLTPQRLCWVEEIVPREADDTDSSWWAQARKFGGKVRDFSRDVVDTMQDKLPYPAHEPIPLADLVVRVAFPREQIASLGPATRRLPAEYQTAIGSLDQPVLRIALHDGSGVDLLTGSEQRARRANELARGNR